MPKQFDLLIFDWDGTLMDSTGVIVDSIQRACEDIGLPTPGERASRQIIGLGLIQALQTLLPDLPADAYPRLVERYRHHYLGRDMQIPLFEGVETGIGQLHESGFQLAVATGKSRLGLSRALETSGLEACFPPPAAPTRRIPSRIGDGAGTDSRTGCRPRAHPGSSAIPATTS